MTLRWTLRKRESLRESVWETETPAMWTWVPNHQKFSSDPEQIKQNLKGLHPISHAWSLKVTIKPGVCKNEYGNTKKVNFDLTILGHQDKMTVSICDYITLIQCNTNCLWYHMDFPCPSFFCTNHFEICECNCNGYGATMCWYLHQKDHSDQNPNVKGGGDRFLRLQLQWLPSN